MPLSKNSSYEECLICGNMCRPLELHEARIPLCPDCHSQIVSRFLPSAFTRFCSRCGVPLSIGTLCGTCESPAISPELSILSCFPYAGIVRKLIHWYKFGFVRELGPYFAYHITHCIEAGISSSEFPVLVPIPGNRKNIRLRGWDQVEEMIRHVDRPFFRMLASSRGRKEQKHLDREAREQNSRNAIRVDGKETASFRQLEAACCNGPEQPRVILIDDISTTGSTLRNAARLLSGHGINVFYAITLAMD